MAAAQVCPQGWDHRYPACDGVWDAQLEVPGCPVWRWTCDSAREWEAHWLFPWIFTTKVIPFCVPTIFFCWKLLGLIPGGTPFSQLNKGVRDEFCVQPSSCHWVSNCHTVFFKPIAWESYLRAFDLYDAKFSAEEWWRVVTDWNWQTLQHKQHVGFWKWKPCTIHMWRQSDNKLGETEAFEIHSSDGIWNYWPWTCLWATQRERLRCNTSPDRQRFSSRSQTELKSCQFVHLHWLHCRHTTRSQIYLL